MHTISIYEHSSGHLTLSFVKLDYVCDSKGGDPSTLPVWKNTQRGGAEPLHIVSVWKKTQHKGGGPLRVASMWKKTQRRGAEPLHIASCG